jgi:hypothetical protein
MLRACARECPKTVCVGGACRASVGGLSASRLDLAMRLTPEPPALRRWRLWIAAVIVAEICWFALLRPRIRGYQAVLVLALLPLAVVGYVYLMAAVSAYLADKRWDFRLRQMMVVMLGLSVGCLVFALLWLAKVHFESELG